MRVLAVNQSAEIKADIRDLLNSAGFEIQSAKNYQEAEDLVSRRNFDVILLGDDLEDQSSLESLREFRTNHVGEETPILLITKE